MARRPSRILKKQKRRQPPILQWLLIAVLSIGAYKAIEWWRRPSPAPEPRRTERPGPAPEPDPDAGTSAPRWRLALPWSAIRGVGAARARSLEAALPGGLAALTAGVPADGALSFLPAALRRQVQDLAAFVSTPPPAVAALARASADRRVLDGPPSGVDAGDWQALVAALAPLLDALDRSVARAACGESLFR